MPFLVSLFFGFAPMLIFAVFLYWSDRYEKEPWLLLGAVFFWGAVIAAGGAFIINTIFGIGIFIFSNSEAVTNLATYSLIAPVVEEFLKGFAVLIVFLVIRKEFDSIMDGIIYAGVTALGFAATENTYYIFNHGFLENGWQGLWMLVFVRVVLVGWQHPFYSAFTGIGLATARLIKTNWIRVIAPLVGFGLSIGMHSLHNTLAIIFVGPSGMVVSTLFDWTGWFMMFLFILWAIYREKQNIKTYLAEEVSQGMITMTNYQIASSAWSQFKAAIQAIFTGNYKNTRRFYQLCGELAHKKLQLARLGNEDGNQAAIQVIQAELVRLSPLV